MTKDEGVEVLRGVDITVEKSDFTTTLVISEHDGPGQFRVETHSNANALREVFDAIRGISQSESCNALCRSWQVDEPGSAIDEHAPNCPNAARWDVIPAYAKAAKWGMFGDRCGGCRWWMHVVGPGKVQCENPGCRDAAERDEESGDDT